MTEKQDKDPERFDKASMLAMAEVREAVDETINDHNITVEDMRAIVMSCCPTSLIDEAEAWLDKLKDDLFDPDRRLFLRPYDIEGGEMMADFKKTVALWWIRQLEYPPSLSKIGGMNLRRQRARMYRKHLVKDIFISGMRPGSVGVIWGIPGSGKTDILVNEIYVPCRHLPHVQFVTNVPIDDPENPMYKRVTRISDAMLHICEHALAGFEEHKKPGMTVFGFDEGQFSRDRQQAASEKNQAQKQFNLIFRKFGVFQWVIYQQNNVPTEIRDFATHWIHKVAREPHQDMADLSIPSEGINWKLRGILGVDGRIEHGMETYKFQSFNPDIFTIDIHPMEMMDYVSNLPETNLCSLTENSYNNIIDYINARKGHAALLSDTVIGVLLLRQYNNCQASKDPALKKMASYRKLGATVGWSKDKVDFWFRKLKERSDIGLLISPDTDTEQVIDRIETIEDELAGDDNTDKAPSDNKPTP